MFLCLIIERIGERLNNQIFIKRNTLLKIFLNMKY